MSRIETIGNATLYLGDCLDVLKTLPTNSVDSVVCDPPYGLSFMGKKWDYDVPSVEIWAECLRVLKPGGHLLAFAGTRTQHRMAVRIEDAGFEIRDMIAWVYGSGFPKSLDVLKAIDKAAGAEREVVVTVKKTPSASSGCNEGWRRPWAEGKTTMDITAPATDAARQWQGWGTALKPALEPITMARKPLVGTVAANVLEHGTGALNIDGCRVGTNGEVTGGSGATKRDTNVFGDFAGNGGNTTPEAGRWPANLILSDDPEVLAGFPVTGPSKASMRGVGLTGDDAKVYGKGDPEFNTSRGHNDNGGSAARFFYAAKASKKDREEGLDNAPQKTAGVGDERPSGSFNERLGKTPTAPRANTHPTVKPTDLMAYLCRLVTPPGGVVLDPFMGSGSTGKAALREGFGFIGVECEPAYFDIACRRIEQAHAQGQLFEPTQAAPVQLGLEAA